MSHFQQQSCIYQQQIQQTEMIFRSLQQRLSNLNNNLNLQRVFCYEFCDSPYKVPYNINYEQHRDYLKKVEKAQITLEQAAKANLVPRRKRRIYDRPKHDLDITDYTCFRENNPENMQIKLYGEHCTPVSCKISLQPKWLVHAFGKPSLPINNPRSATGEYLFRDLDMGTFLLYDYRTTTAYKKNVQGFDYENQSHIRPGMRLIYRLSPQQFWQSQNFYDFRVNASIYAFKLKFKEWMLSQVQKRKSRESYDEYINKKYGHVHTFNLKGQEDLFVKKEPLLKYVTPEVFTSGLENIKKNEKKGTDVKMQKKKKKAKKQDENQQASVQIKVEEQQSEKKEQTISNFQFARKLDQEFRIARQKSEEETLKYYAESK